LFAPYGLAVDASGVLYIADSSNYRVRQVSNGVITTIAGNGTVFFSGDNGPATNAGLSEPLGVAVDRGGNLYIADGSLDNRIREVSNGVIATVAGDGATVLAVTTDPPKARTSVRRPGVCCNGR